MPENAFKTIIENLLNRFIANGFGYLWFVGMGIWGGTVAYLTRIKNTGKKFMIAHMAMEWVISGFNGIITAYICYSLSVDFYMTSALCGMAGHMGGRGTYIIRSFLEQYSGLKR